MHARRENLGMSVGARRSYEARPCTNKDYVILNRETRIFPVKPAGFLLLLAGWGLVLSALSLLGSAAPRASFALAGFAVELLGLILVIRSHLPPPREERG